MSKRIEYKYKRVSRHVNERYDLTHKAATRYAKWLNEQGRKGWELFSVYWAYGGPRFKSVFHFRKPK